MLTYKILASTILINLLANCTNKYDKALIYSKLGVSYTEQKEFTLARWRLLKAEQLAPKMYEVNAALAYLYSNLKQLPLADAYFRKSILYADNKAMAQNDYGAFLCANNKFKNGRQQLLKAIQARNNLTIEKTYQNLASCLQQQGKFEQATKYLQLSYMENSQNHKLLLDLALNYLKQKQYKQAKITLNKYWDTTKNIDLQTLNIALTIAKATSNLQEVKAYSQQIDNLTKI